MVSSYHSLLQTEQPQVPQLLPVGQIVILWFTGDNQDSQFSGIFLLKINKSMMMPEKEESHKFT